MKVSRKVLSALLAACILAGTLAGCAGGDNNTSSGTSSDVSSETSSQTSSTESSPETTLKVSDNFNPEGLPILKEPDTFKVVITQQSTQIAAKDKQCYIDSAKETNINFDFVEISAASWKEKVNIMFASDDLPDMFWDDVPEISTQYEQLAVLDEYIEAYAPNVMKLFEDRPEYKGILTAPDGKIHFLPGGDEAYMNQIDQQLWMNKNWLEAVNMEIPTTTDEFYNVLKAFKEQDANGNGDTTDEIPFSFNGIWDWATGIGNMFGSFGVPLAGGQTFVKDGKVVLASKEEGLYEALKYFNKLYSEKLIDQEVFTQSLEQYNSRGKGKDVFGSVVAYRAHYALGSEHKENYVGVVPLKGPDGTQMVKANYINQLSGYQITTACEQPEALVRFYDYANSSTEMVLKWNRGYENINWKYVDIDGEQKIVPNLTVDPNATPPVGRGDTSFSVAAPCVWMLHRDEAISVTDPDQPVDIKKDLIAASMPFAIYGLPTGLDTAENTQKKALIATDLETYLKKFISDSIINGIDDAKWEDHLKTLEKLRVDEYVALEQEYYDSKM